MQDFLITFKSLNLFTHEDHWNWGIHIATPFGLQIEYRNKSWRTNLNRQTRMIVTVPCDVKEFDFDT